VVGMVLFKVSNGKAKQVNFSRIKNEKELQNLVENNLKEIFGLILIESEFAVNPFRLDTVAFDYESKAFVIIEYKESEDYSIIDQGISYLNTLLNHKGDFQLALERKLNKQMNIDWTQSRILFIAKSYNAFQLGAYSKDLPFELWEYIPYEEGIIAFEQIKPQYAKTTSFPIGKIAKAVEKEIKVYTLEDRLAGKNETIKEIFESLREAILKFNPEIKEKVTKHYVAYQLTRNFTEFVIQSSAVKVYLDIPLAELKDNAHTAQDCTEVGHWATGDTRFKVHSPDEVAYAIELIKQAYEKNLR
jgi:predicted transport protein